MTYQLSHALTKQPGGTKTTPRFIYFLLHDEGKLPVLVISCVETAF